MIRESWFLRAGEVVIRFRVHMGSWVYSVSHIGCCKEACNNADLLTGPAQASTTSAHSFPSQEKRQSIPMKRTLFSKAECHKTLSSVLYCPYSLSMTLSKSPRLSSTCFADDLSAFMLEPDSTCLNSRLNASVVSLQLT